MGSDPRPLGDPGKAPAHTQREQRNVIPPHDETRPLPVGNTLMFVEEFAALAELGPTLDKHSGKELARLLVPTASILVARFARAMAD